MQNRINIIQPEIIAEQIFSYSIQSYEALKSAKREIKSGYNFALIPKGSHIYTGILQTTGYLMLDSTRENLIIISIQEHNPTQIEIYNDKIGPILGFYFDGLKFSSKNKKYTRTKEIPSELEFQLNIARIIKDTKKYIHIGIGSQITDKDIKSLIKILQTYDDSNFIFISNLTENQEIKKCKNIDSKVIEDVSMQKSIEKNTILNTFINFSRNSDRKPEIVMYANSGDLDSNTKRTNGYVCMVF